MAISGYLDLPSYANSYMKASEICVVYLERWTSAQGSQGWRASSTDVGLEAIDTDPFLHFDLEPYRPSTCTRSMYKV